MTVFGERLRERASSLALSQADIARRAGLSDRRYSNYVTGRTEPDLATLVRIAHALETTPDALLGIGGPRPPSRRLDLIDRLSLAIEPLSDGDLELVIVQALAVAHWRQQPDKSG